MPTVSWTITYHLVIETPEGNLAKGMRQLNVKSDLGIKATDRQVIEADGTYALREPGEAYAGKSTGKMRL